MSYELRIMLKILKIIFLILILNSSFLILNSTQVNAQSVSLGVWPPILQVMIQPGKGITQVYKLNNLGDPVIITSSAVPFVAQNETGEVDLIDCQKVEVIGCESVGWISFQNADLDLGQSFFLSSGRTQEVVLKINIPEYASEGDYYNTLLFTTKAPPSEGEKRSKSTAAIASNILITVSKSGNPTRTINIVEFAVKKIFGLPIFDSFNEIPITLRVQNTGTAYTAVKGKIKLLGFPGLQSNFTIPSQNVLAGNTRLLTATSSAEISQHSPGRSRFTTPSRWPPPAGGLEGGHSLILPKGFYLGRYTLVAEVENDEGLVKKATINFFAVPLNFVYLFIGIAVFLYFSLKLSKKYRKRRFNRGK